MTAQKEAARLQLMAQLTPQQRSFFAKRRQASIKPSTTGSWPQRQPTAPVAVAQPSEPSAARSITAADAGSEDTDRPPNQPTLSVPAKSSRAPSSSALASNDRQQPDAASGPALTAGLLLPAVQPSSIADRARFSLAGEPCSLQQEQPQSAEAAVLRDPLRSAPKPCECQKSSGLCVQAAPDPSSWEHCNALPGAVL